MKNRNILQSYIGSVGPAQLTFGGAWLVGRGLPFEFARSRVRERARICRNLVSSLWAGCLVIAFV